MRFLLNLPYTIIGLFLGLTCIPIRTEWHKNPPAIIMPVKSFWWAMWIWRGARAATIGHVILLSPKTEPGDLEHELVHVAQYIRAPLIHPLLYFINRIRYGYRNNPYEEEAYRGADNRYAERF